MNAPRRLDVPALLHRVCAWLLIPLIVLATSAEVLARYVFRTPLQWSEEVITFSLLLVFVGTIPYGVTRNVHVKVETLYENFPPAARRLSDALGSLCGAAFLGMLAVGAGRETWGLATRGDRAEMTGWLQWPFAAAVCLIAAYCAGWLVLIAVRSLSAGSAR